MTKLTGVSVQVDGTSAAHVFDSDELMSGLYKVIGTDIVQVVSFNDELEMWVDEEGALKPGRVVNKWLTSLNQALNGATYEVYGIGVFLGGSDDEGMCVGLSPSQVDALLS